MPSLCTSQRRISVPHKLVAEEKRSLKSNLDFKNELLMMLEQAGFAGMIAQGDYTDVEATPEHGVLVFIARKKSKGEA